MAVTSHDREVWAAMRKCRRRLRAAVRRAVEWNRSRRSKAAEDADPFRAFLEDFRGGLIEAYDRAWQAGASKAGGSANPYASRTNAEIEYSHDEPYVFRFAQEAVLGDAYLEGDLDWPFARAELYVRRVRGVANRAFAEHSPDGLLFDWVLGDAEHCDDCPRLAADGPYLRTELAHVPADGSTECLGQCRCTLRRSDGVEGIAPEPRPDAEDEDGEEGS